MMELTFQERLDCPHSYGSPISTKLLCDYSFCEVCDGTLYEHCTWDINLSKVLEMQERKHQSEEV